MGIAFTMEWIADPSIWAGLVTLIVIELVLGIDNLVFIAILAEKLPPAQRDYSHHGAKRTAGRQRQREPDPALRR